MLKIGNKFFYQAFILLEYIVPFLGCRDASVHELVTDWAGEGACSDGGILLLN